MDKLWNDYVKTFVPHILLHFKYSYMPRRIVLGHNSGTVSIWNLQNEVCNIILLSFQNSVQ
jgi:hypothetical protein